MSQRPAPSPTSLRGALDRGPALALAATLLIALVLRGRHLSWGLPDLFEEATPFFRGWEMWHWGPPVSVDLDPRFFRYPSLTFYVHFLAQGALAACLRLTGTVAAFADVPAEFLAHRERFLLVARAVTALFGVATVGATFELGRRAAGRGAALAAAVLLAVNPFHVERSQFIEVDVPLGLFVAWGLVECLRLAEAPDLRAHLRAGACIGLAASTKYTGAMLAVPLFAAHFLGERGRGGRPAGRLGRLAAAGAAALVAFAVTSPFVLADFDLARLDVRSEQTHMQAGHFGMDHALAWREYARSLPEHVLGWPVALAAVAALVVCVLIRRRPAAIVLAAYVVAYAAVVGSWTMRAERYLLPLLPPLAVMAAMLPAEVAGPRRGLAFAAAALLVGGSSLSARPAAARAALDPRSEAREWIETHVPAGAFLLMEAWGPDLLGPEDLWKLSPAVRRAFLQRGARPLYAIQYLPTYQTQPELAGPYYDLALYPDADVCVLSSFVGDRFRADPPRYAKPCALYAEVAERWVKAAEFRPAPETDAPTITVFAQQRHAAPFARRPEVPVDSVAWAGLAGVPGAATCCARLGLDYETFGFVRTALACYESGLRASEFPPGTLESLAAGIGRCMLAQGRAREAAEVVARIAQACKPAEERRRILAFVQGLRSLAANGAGTREDAKGSMGEAQP